MTYTLTAQPNTIVRDSDGSFHTDRSRQRRLSGCIWRGVRKGNTAKAYEPPSTVKEE